MADYATKQDVKDIVAEAVTDLSTIIADFAAQVGGRFNKVESRLGKVEGRLIKLEFAVNENTSVIKQLQADVQSILNRLYSIEKDIKINEDERVVIGMQLTRIHDWIEQAAARIDIEFVH